MKIKLIAPHDENLLSSAETFKFQRLNLPLLAALTPPEHTVKIIDEAFAPDDIDHDFDLVGITVMTDLALRAYRIADGYRQQGVKVVMGGIHPTVLPHEALHHADAVVIGEAETGRSYWMLYRDRCGRFTPPMTSRNLRGCRGRDGTSIRSPLPGATLPFPPPSKPPGGAPMTANSAPSARSQAATADFDPLWM